MEKFFSTKHLRYAAWAVAMAAVLQAAGFGAARAQEEDSTGLADFEKRVYRGLMGSLGFKGGEEAIEYRERSPLVLPPGRDLPPPQAAAPRPTAWPVDPEQAKRKAAAQKKKDARFYDGDRRGEALMPSEYGGGRS